MIPLPSSIKAIQKKDKNTKVFEIQPLYPGYGVTIGNALRRVLLSSIEGTAVTQVKIKGAEHEFSTLKGVLEDVLTIILNIKKLNFKIYGDIPQRAKLKVSGEREVKGSDFKLPAQVELLNPEVHIATLTSSKAELEIEVQIERGIGYEPQEWRKRKLPIGEIAIDASYSPVVRVAFNVEKTRVQERTDFDKLLLEVETNGVISPEEAVISAIEILMNHLSLIKNALVPKEEAKEKVKEGLKEKKEEGLKIDIKNLKLSTRTFNVLQKNKVSTLDEILKLGKEGLKNLKGMGERGMKELERKIKKQGLELR
jgi:DNA-directed RNA polymerase subunit alpha